MLQKMLPIHIKFCVLFAIVAFSRVQLSTELIPNTTLQDKRQSKLLFNNSEQPIYTSLLSTDKLPLVGRFLKLPDR